MKEIINNFAIAELDKICGFERGKIRKAYFTGKLPKLLNDIQALGEQTEESLETLKTYLQSLRDEDTSIGDGFSDFLPKDEDIQVDPVLDDLNKESLSDEEQSEMTRDETNRKNSVIHAVNILKSLFARFRSDRKPTDDDLMDMGFELLGLQYHVGREEIYRERLFRKKITEYERMGKQRKAAEEYAKVCKEYRDWRVIEKLELQIESFINLAKKKYHNL
jgi:hypothetical protein